MSYSIDRLGRSHKILMLAIDASKLSDFINSHTAYIQIIKKNMNVDTIDEIYRVQLFGDGQVDVVCFGMESFDNPLEGRYDSTDELPQWLQERLAVLSMLPVANDQGVAGIGRRISETIYWALKPTI